MMLTYEIRRNVIDYHTQKTTSKLPKSYLQQDEPCAENNLQVHRDCPLWEKGVTANNKLWNSACDTTFEKYFSSDCLRPPECSDGVTRRKTSFQPVTCWKCLHVTLKIDKHLIVELVVATADHSCQYSRHSSTQLCSTGIVIFTSCWV